MSLKYSSNSFGQSTEVLQLDWGREWYCLIIIIPFLLKFGLKIRKFVGLKLWSIVMGREQPPGPKFDQLGCPMPSKPKSNCTSNCVKISY